MNFTRVALHDSAVIAEDHDPDVVGLEVERHALEARRELNHLTCFHRFQTVDTGDTISDREDTSDLLDALMLREVRDALRQNLRELRRAHLGESRRRGVERPGERREHRRPRGPHHAGDRTGAQHRGFFSPPS